MDEQLLQNIINKWGKQTQTRKIKEEILELALVITHLDIPTKDPDEVHKNLIEELADVKIMMAQAEIMFGKEAIDRKVAEKLNKIQVRFPDLAVSNKRLF